MRRRPVDERFWALVDRSDPSGCWPWRGERASSGYGLFRPSGNRTGKRVVAHRFAWELLRGPIPKGLFCCHHCDHRPCTNPDHIFLGDNAANMADMVRKGRQAKQLGSTGHNAKLTEADVVEIRRLASTGVLQSEIRETFKLSKGSICDIVNGRTWRHVPMPEPVPQPEQTRPTFDLDWLHNPERIARDERVIDAWRASRLLGAK